MSEHNHPNQQVGSQYNADAINIHHHHAPQEGARPGDDAAARVREELEQFKKRFADAADKEDEEELSSLLIEGEDLLTHVCGPQRYEDFKRAVAEIPPRQRLTRWLVDHGKVLARSQAFESLKRRVAGIAYRK
jgi:hypothetical protein